MLNAPAGQIFIRSHKPIMHNRESISYQIVCALGEYRCMNMHASANPGQLLNANY